MYGDIVLKLSKLVAAELLRIETFYNFDLGDEFEVAMCHVLRAVLPGKYGVCRGHAVTSDGRQAGDDILIFDLDASPTLRFLNRGDYSRKEHIPIDAVYAYIEAKSTLWLDASGPEGQSLQKALSQVETMRQLGRPDRPHAELLPGVTLSSALLNVVPGGLQDPDRANPLICAIFSKRVGWERQVRDAGELPDWTRTPIDLGDKSRWPDLIVAGANLIFLPDSSTKEETIALRLFADSKAERLRLFSKPARAMGAGLASLIHALDSVALKKIDWSAVVLAELNRAADH